jgi:hypothetical protein
MILCPRTGRKPWKCLCPECVAQRTAVGPDVSPTPNRDAGWAAPRAVILSDRPVRIESFVTLGPYFFSRWRRAPGGDILWGPDGQPQREGGPGDGGLQCCVPEQSRSLLRGAMHVASVKPATVVQLFRTANSEYFALRTFDGEYTFSRDTLDRALREMHEAKCERLNNTQGTLDMVVSETGVHTPRHWVERAYPVLVTCNDLIVAARAMMFVPPSESIELRTTDAQDIYVARWRDGVHSFTRHALYGRAAEIAKAQGNDELAADILRSSRSFSGPGDGSLWPQDVLDQFEDLFERHRMAGAPGQHPNLGALGLCPQPGPQQAFMIGEHQDKRTFELGEWARNGEWGTELPPAELVFRQETDPHLVARARRLMGARRHLCGYPRFCDDTGLSLFYCSVDDRYLIRVPLEHMPKSQDVVVGHDELVDYRVPPDAIPIDRLSTRIAVHRALEGSTKRKIPFPELRAWLQSTVGRVFCAWGAGVATLGAQGIAELGLQKTDRSPTMESPE